jgi:hypothetical protein
MMRINEEEQNEKIKTKKKFFFSFLKFRNINLS